MPRPKFLYRYRSLADETLRERTRQIVAELRLYFARPSTFNDPFDCFPLFDLNASEAEYVRHWVRFFGHHREGLDQSVSIARAMKSGDPDAIRFAKGGMEAIVEMLLNENGVLCLNTDPLHQLMWSHYADCHRGLCLQFHGQHTWFEHAMPVHYTNERPVLNIFNQDDAQQVRSSLLTKSDVWAYENEWRVAEVEFVGNKDFPRNAISAVILGARISPDNAALVRQWAASHVDPIPVHEARLHGSTFQIEVPGLAL